MICFCAGGTGGHLFPAQAIAEKIRGNLGNDAPNMMLITDQRAFPMVDQRLFDIIVENKIRRTNPIVYLFDLTLAVFRSLYYMLRYKVKNVIGFGGYPSLPGCISAVLLRKRLYIHEQNFNLGKANRFLSRYANTIYLSYSHKEARQKLPLKVVGNPIRDVVVQAQQKEREKNQKFHILVVGGSQGSEIFSKVIPAAILSLPNNIKNQLQITQQCRESDIKTVTELYAQQNISHEIASFFRNLPSIIHQADFVISRAGATIIAETSFLEKPTLFVPLKASKEGDQAANAKHLKNKNCCWILQEDAFTSENVRDLLEKVILQPDLLNEKINNLKKISNNNAADFIARDLLKSN